MNGRGGGLEHMRFVNGMAGLALLVIAFNQVGERDWEIWLPVYAVGSLIALSTLKSRMPVWVLWCCAAAATGAMFCYFSLFFQIAPHLRGDWISHGHSSTNLLVAAFCMIPALAEFSARMKAEPEAEAARGVAGQRLWRFPSRIIARFAPRRSPAQRQVRQTTP